MTASGDSAVLIELSLMLSVTHKFKFLVSGLFTWHVCCVHLFYAITGFVFTSFQFVLVLCHFNIHLTEAGGMH